MAPYPPPRQPLTLQASKPTTAPFRSRRSSKPSTASVHAASLRRGGAPHDARGLRALVKSLTTTYPVLNEAAALHAHAAKLGLDHHRAVRDGLVALYLACDRRVRARALFHDGPLDVVSWTNMVIGHARLELFDEDEELFFAMANGCGVAVDTVATTAAKVALGVVACNTLVGMYAKCGDTVAAHRCFTRMLVKKNVVSFYRLILSQLKCSSSAPLYLPLSP